MRTLSWLVVAAVLWTLPVAAGNASPGGPVADKAAVIAAFEKLSEEEADLDARQQELIAKLREVGREDEAAREKYMKVLGELRAERTAAEEAFRAVFEPCDWNAFDAKEHAALLEKGLVNVGNHLRESDPKRAIEAYEMLLAKVPDARSAAAVRQYWLPSALISTGDLDRTVVRISSLADGAGDSVQRGLWVTVGDVYCAKGEIPKGLEFYRKALEGLPETMERGDRRSSAKRNADLRLALVGKPAPNIDAKTWLGSDAASLEAMRGKVCVVDFWATWCGPCRTVMPALNRLYQEHRNDPFQLVGLTRFYDYGFLPDGPEMKGGKSVRPIAEDAFLDHLKEFKKISGISYPFAVGEKGDFENYKVSGIPTVVVIGADGKVALVGVGSGSEPLVRAAVDRALARVKQ